MKTLIAIAVLALLLVASMWIYEASELNLDPLDNLDHQVMEIYRFDRQYNESFGALTQKFYSNYDRVLSRWVSLRAAIGELTTDVESTYPDNPWFPEYILSLRQEMNAQEQQMYDYFEAASVLKNSLLYLQNTIEKNRLSLLPNAGEAELSRLLFSMTRDSVVAIERNIESLSGTDAEKHESLLMHLRVINKYKLRTIDILLDRAELKLGQSLDQLQLALQEHRKMLEEKAGQYRLAALIISTLLVITVVFFLLRILVIARKLRLNISALTTEIGQRIKSEQALNDSMVQLDGILNVVGSSVIAVDERQHIVIFNQRACQVFGYNRQEIVGQPLSILVPSVARKTHDNMVEEFTLSGEPSLDFSGRADLQGLRKDGEVFPIEIAVSRLELEDRSLFVAALEDVSERKKSESLLLQSEKMATVGGLVAGISHDFNNILAVIIGNLELLESSGTLKTDDRVLIQEVKDAADRAAELTKRLLGFSRKKSFKVETTNVLDLLISSDALMRGAVTPQIELTINADPELWLVDADQGDLKDALLNLLINAGDAMPDGGEIRISCENKCFAEGILCEGKRLQAGEYVRTAVSDDGTGMSEEVRKHAIDPFFSSKEPGVGTGLGLSMVYGFVMRCEGGMVINSNLGEGTVIEIYLPRSSENTVSEPTQPGLEEADLPQGDELVLIVDDEPQLVDLAVRFFQSLGYRTLFATGPEDALETLRRSPSIDLLFTDIVMPGEMNGLGLAEKARELIPGLKILLASGYAEKSLEQKIYHRWNGKVLRKPYRKRDLAFMSREVLDQETGITADTQSQ